MAFWIDTHCHLDAFGDQAAAVRDAARAKDVGLCVYPAVERANFDTIRELAHAHQDAYALGIHPLYVPQASDSDLTTLEHALHQHATDPRLVAVGEIGLDFLVPSLCTPDLRDKQQRFYTAQLHLAHAFGLPVILHVRKSADQLLKALRQLHAQGKTVTGIAHAFNGSMQQAEQFIELGFKLGFGGASTYDRARNLHRRLRHLPPDSIVLETDAPDMPPHWLYTTAAQRAEGMAQARNTPAELPRIAECIAQHASQDITTFQTQCYRNSLTALPKLCALLLPTPQGSASNQLT